MLISDNARTVLERRYLTKDEHGNLTETVEGLFRRVADAIAIADEKYDKKANTKQIADAFYDAMVNLEFMPNSPTLMNAGRPLGQLSACFVLPIPDSMEGIFDAVKAAALIHKSGGGTGFSFSRLRPTGDSVRSTGGVASGPISFMKVFNAATEAVKQGGTRRGANMGILRVDHPDAESFIVCKADATEITNFNISIGLTEAFMKAVELDQEFDVIDPRKGEKVARKRARPVFDLIVEMAWKNGEPGIVFLDRMNRDNVVPSLGEFEATNPCGEQPLLPYESCNLGSINLARMLDKDHRINYEKLGKTVDLAVHFLDNVIDVNKYPLDEIAETTLRTRKIGLGVMGFADLLFAMGIGYDSDKGVKIAEEVMSFINERSKIASRALAKIRGPFPAFEQSIYASGEPIRNGTTTTIAPTGTISILCGASSGVEPLFALAFVRNVMDNDSLPEVHPYFMEVAKQRGFFSKELMIDIAREGTAAHIDGVPGDIKQIFTTAHDISPEYHIRMQAAFQRHTDNAVSKTVNFQNDATRDDVRNVYVMAYEQGLKGVTIYRDGSRDMQVLSVGTGKDKPAVAEAPALPRRITPRPRPDVTRGLTEKVRIGCGSLFITVNYDDLGICEVFTNLGRAGGCPSQSEASSRLASIALRSGVDIDEVIEQLRGIRCHSTLRQKGLKVLSCPDAIGRVLEKVKLMLEQGTQLSLIDPEAQGDIGALPESKHACLDNCSLCSMQDTCQASDHGQNDNACPDCGAEMEHEGGCVICRACGYSKCN